MKYLFGFIGCGNMGGTLARAICQQVDPKTVALSDIDVEKVTKLSEDLGCISVGSNNYEIAQSSKFIVLGCKPYHMDSILGALAEALSKNPEAIVVSMIASATFVKLQKYLGTERSIIRIMPNTPVATGFGMVEYSTHNVSEADLQTFLTSMQCAGLLDAIPENLIDIACCVSASGPAWVYQMIEALADGGVSCGLPRAKAQMYAAQMVAGAAHMVLQSGKHPGQLKDEVCTPGGNTVVGVLSLEEHGFRASLIGAVRAAYARTLEMGK